MNKLTYILNGTEQQQLKLGLEYSFTDVINTLRKTAVNAKILV